jgi:flagellar basal body-associated protein FliL
MKQSSCIIIIIVIVVVVLFGCEMWSFTLSEEHNLQVFQKETAYENTLI